MSLEAALARARRAVARNAGASAGPAFDAAVEQSLEYLGSERARADLARDPYWPKWGTPWWHIALLDELGLATRIPRAVAERVATSIDEHYLHFFPFVEDDVPPGADPYRHIICHCALGTAVRVLHRCGIDVDRRLPWARGWILEYQLPDGGLNCDEEAYVRPVKRSSVVSTLPPAEAVLHCTARPFDAGERAFLAGVAAYLSERSLVRSLSKGRVIDPAWLTPCFPRFYFYDALRGLGFLAHWAERCGERVAWDSIAGAVTSLDAWFSADGDLAPRQPHAGHGTLRPDGAGAWRRVPESETFPLLQAAVPSGAAAARLRLEWLDTLEVLAMRAVVA